VKHSELEVEPQAAAVLCGDALAPMRQFAEDIHTWGEELGLVGPRELDRLWTRHLLNSALLAKKLPAGTLADIGSGAGFPGLVVAVLRPDIHCTLIEPLGRRANWLTEEAARLGLTNVTVHNQRAEDVAGHVLVDAVTARAVSALTTLLPIAIPLLRVGGELFLMKGHRVDQEVRDAAETMVKWNITTARVEITGPEYETEETRIFRATVGK